MSKVCKYYCIIVATSYLPGVPAFSQNDLMNFAQKQNIKKS